MNIIQISAYFPPSLGGQQQRIKDLSENLSKKGHSIEVFTSNIGCPKDKQIISTKNLKINYLPAWEFAHTPIIPSLFWNLMKIPKDSIMHVHIAQPLVPEIVWLVSKLKRIPYICHIRTDTVASGNLGFLLPLYKSFFLSRVLKDATKIISLNKDFYNLVINKYRIIKTNVHIIPNATNFNIINSIKKKNVNFIKLLFVGRFTPEKNIDKILIALTKINNLNGFNIQLNLIGEGFEKQKLIELTETLKIGKSVKFNGRVEGKKLQEFYINSDILILPSSMEGFSSTLLEAMATGTAIIASNIPGTRCVIKNNYNGLLIDPSPEKIAEAIKKLIENPKLREKLARNGLKEIKKYSWDKIVEQTEQVYKEVLNHKK
ncbi:MAG: glycosyltransferase family 4 protein [Flavobacterium sp.]|uniref:glycosyltransferase family 4 protein n=1 Tax=Flavobacterium sp. TaxID=239 RepID=UPI00260798D5|nr:glycosyltransferase family 4 protein [Flavobacterium sp.]MDD5149116.1 glycosyltransferase family 4 protein [Flavobacterium sp.]